MPLISIVTPVFNPEAHALRECLESVRRQGFLDWEHCLVDDASSSPHVRDILDAAAIADHRVRLAFRSENGGIVAASNDGLQLAAGEYVAFLDHDDALADGVLAEVARALQDDPTIDYLYTDEDHLTASGHSFSRVYKPDWSPERFRSHMYTCHLSVLRRQLALDVGGFLRGYEGSQDYDLILRVTERARAVRHLPILGYHWRMGVDSTAANPLAKPYAHAAGLRAVEDHCERLGIPAEVEMLSYQGYHRLRRRVQGAPTVSVVVPTAGTSSVVWGRQRVYVIEALRDLIERSSYKVHEIVLVADPRTPAAVLEAARLIAGDRLSIVAGTDVFDFSAAINRGVAHSTGEVVLLLNDDVQIIDDDFLETMIGLIQDEGVAIVGCRLLYADGTLQHAGHVYNGGAFHAFLGHGTDVPGPNGLLLVDREVSGVTAACMLVRRPVFDEVGGFSRAFPMNYNDVDFCLKVRRQGYRIVYSPHSSLYHFESGTRRNEVSAAEQQAVRDRWAAQLENDPYHHPALLKARDDWAVPYGTDR